jgi:putative salt-induced outer membrane protein
MMKKAVCFLILGCGLVLSAFGRGAETAKEPPSWRGDIALGLSLARGNSRTTSFSLAFSAAGPVNRAATLIWSNKGLYLFGESDGTTSTENLLLSSRLDWKHSDRFFTFLEVQGIRDRFKNYASRILPAVGAGYRLIAGEAVTLGIDAGLTHVFTRYYDSGLGEGETGLKIGERLVWKIGGASEFNEVAELVPVFASASRYYLRLEASLTAPLDGHWAVKLTVIDAYDSRPVGPGVVRNDLAFIASLSRSF